MTTVLSVNNYHYYRGGAETVFLEHNRMLDYLGWNVVPFSMRHGRNLPTPWDRYFVDEIEFGHSYSLGEKLTRASRIVYSLQARERLDELLAVAPVDISHLHNIYHHISPSILGLLSNRGIPVVMTLHDLKIACPAYNMLARDGICERCRGGKLFNVVRHRCIKGSLSLSTLVWIESTLHRMLGSYSDCVDRFVVPSRFYVEKFREWGVSSDRLRHIPNFIDPSRYQPDYDPCRYVLYFGRLSREKGVHTLITAAASAKCRLLIAGTGDALEYLRGLADSLKADVAFLGFLSGEALHAAIRGARAVVLPSEWYENAPMSILEAYALGKPVIGARIGGIPELIEEDRTGFLFESGDAESLAGALARIQAMPDALIRELGCAGRKRVETEFTAETYLNRVLDVYRELGVHIPRSAAASQVLT
jgi:glycosyltransferase involved in cell wall biosynthesis